MRLEKNSSALLRLGILLSLLLISVCAKIDDIQSSTASTLRSITRSHRLHPPTKTEATSSENPVTPGAKDDLQPTATTKASPIEPKVRKTQFTNQPSEILYFDDSSTVLVTDTTAGVVYISADEGTSWDLVDDIAQGEVLQVVMHPTDGKVAVALGTERRHWITQNRGYSWRAFETEKNPTLFGPPLSFHADDSDKVILNVRDEDGGESVFTTDGFKSVEFLRDKTSRCIWAKEQERFTTGDKGTDKTRVLCIVEGKNSRKQGDFRLVISDDYFEDSTGYEPHLEEGRSVSGISSMVAIKGYVVAARQSEGTNEMALYTTVDTKNWHRAQFGDSQIKEDGYTIMESTNYSLQVDVMSDSPPDNPMGMLFTSNSNGTYFTRNEAYTNRDYRGFVDFEKIQGIQGIVLVNMVANWEDVLDAGEKKLLKSQISFDDGRTFQDITTGNKKLHLHSVTDAQNAGKIFSSLAPGLAMGVGNTGEYLEEYNKGDLYVSDDAGISWTKALDGAHKYEFGDSGSILLAIWDETEQDNMIYSLNHGKDWIGFELDSEVRPQVLTTIPDSTSLKFLLLATTGQSDKLKHWIYSIDFGSLDLKKCKDRDFESWHARADEDGDPTCIMGHTQTFRRRKADAHCVVDEEFKDPLPINDNKNCPCTEADFECISGFTRSEDRTECVPLDLPRPAKGECQDPQDTFMSPSGFRYIPGNDCRRQGKGAINKEEPVERSCETAAKPRPDSGVILSEVTTFPSEGFREHYYLERAGSSSGDDETVLMLTRERELWITDDHGKTWRPALPDVEVMFIYPNRYYKDAAYFITPSKTVHYTRSRGKSFHSFEAPGRPNNAGILILRFHPSNPDWLLWTTCVQPGAGCQGWTHVSTKGGTKWDSLLQFVENCEFMYQEGQRAEKLVYCVHHSDETLEGPKELVASEDWFEHRTVHFEDMVGFATMSEFIVVAAKDNEDKRYLKAESSIDGNTFANAQFPHNFQVPHQSAYTVLDSSTHSIFLHVTTNNVPESEFGSIIKSNSNGTSYVMSMQAVNRNALGLVDFEKMLGLEGVAVVNVVANAQEAEEGSAKKLKTMITHNDGAEWSYLEPPRTDAEGKPYECPVNGIDNCSLHLHGYTERSDPRHTYSSPSAVGLMMGIGNVGSYLGKKSEGDTFITRDGGITWRPAKKGQYMWEYGDQGSVIVIVAQDTPTNVVYYSTDEGQEWIEFVFGDDLMSIEDITTVPSDNSRNFLLWGKETSQQGKAVTVNLDFSGLADRPCFLDKENPESEESDYYLYEPKHPFQEDNCLFGHVAQYYRKIPERKCYNGPIIDRLHGIKRNCSCTRQDFECDYNYERQSDGSCKLVPGLQPKDPAQVCKDNPDAYEYYDPTGYRRLETTTCTGGKELQFTSQSHPCPGKEDLYRQHKGIGKLGLFLAITVPIAAACGVGYWVWKNWASKFGQIRLGDGSASSIQLDANSRWVAWPVAAVSALVAVLMATPAVAGSVWRSGSNAYRSLRDRFGRGRATGGGLGSSRTYTSRSSFARGSRDYAAVGNDEADLLGEESDEEA